ncbi:hypothetical protein E4U14_004241 [Claviceps sp. LM454 group G7]|nr:hypothetical protein E4U14_004241 [Claviceps sp. LM454 group G7]
MMTSESDVDSPSASSPSYEGEDARAVIRHLLERHSREEVEHLIAEEASAIPIDRHIRRPGPTGSRRFAQDRLSSRASALRVSSQRQLKTSGRRSKASQKPQKSDYPCGICAEENILKTCTRRNDLRRHIENFHNRNAIWFCQHPGCKMGFDWQGAYQIHLRTAHGRSHMNVDEAMIKVCPQKVFACGFESCIRVFECSSESDAGTTLKEYSGHVVKHFDEGSTTVRWSYSTRIRNLLRQSQVAAFWERAWSDRQQPRLQWDTQRSMAARKTLEAGIVEELPFLVHFLIVLGSSGSNMSELEGRLELPFKKPRVPGSHRLLQALPQAHNPLPHDLENIVRQPFEFSGHMDPESRSGPESGSGAYGTVQASEQESRSVEDIDADLMGRIVDQRQTHHGAYSNAGASLPSHTPPPSSLFYHNPSSSTMFRTTPRVLPAALQQRRQQQQQPPHQHSTGQYVAVTQDPGMASVISPPGFSRMRSVTTNLGSGLSMDMDDYHNHTAPPAPAPTPDPATEDVNGSRDGWIGQYSHMTAVHPSSLSAGGYSLSSQCAATSEHNHRALQGFGSSEQT